MQKTDFSIGLYSRHFHNRNRRGVSIYTHELVQALSQILLHTKIDILDYFLPRINFAYLPQISNPNFETKVLRCPGRIFDFLNKNIGWPKIEMLSKDLDILHVMHEQVPVSKVENIIMTVHGLGPLLHPELFTQKFRSKWKDSLDLGLERAIKVIGVSKTVENQLHEYRPEFSDKYDSTFLGVSNEFLVEPDSRKENEIVASREINFSYILYIGAADPGKNLIKFLEAFSIFSKETKPTPTHHLILVGNPHWGGYEFFKQKVEKLALNDRVHFTGYIKYEHLPAFYRACELFVFPSLFEGFGLPLLEAMASGAPCLVSNRPALDEVGKDVVEYCDPESVDDMADKLKSLLDDPERLSEMRVRGRKYARKFTWVKTAKDTIRIYEEVIGSSLI